MGLAELQKNQNQQKLNQNPDWNMVLVSQKKASEILNKNFEVINSYFDGLIAQNEQLETENAQLGAIIEKQGVKIKQLEKDIEAVRGAYKALEVFEIVRKELEQHIGDDTIHHKPLFTKESAAAATQARIAKSGEKAFKIVNYINQPGVVEKDRVDADELCKTVGLGYKQVKNLVGKIESGEFNVPDNEVFRVFWAWVRAGKKFRNVSKSN